MLTTIIRAATEIIMVVLITRLKNKGLGQLLSAKADSLSLPLAGRDDTVID